MCDELLKAQSLRTRELERELETVTSKNAAYEAQAATRAPSDMTCEGEWLDRAGVIFHTSDPNHES